MAANRYFIVNIPNPNMEQIYNIAVQGASTIRKNLAGDKGIVKLYCDDTDNHGILNGYTEYTHAEIRQYLKDNSADW